MSLLLLVIHASMALQPLPGLGLPQRLPPFLLLLIPKKNFANICVLRLIILKIMPNVSVEEGLIVLKRQVGRILSDTYMLLNLQLCYTLQSEIEIVHNLVGCFVTYTIFSLKPERCSHRAVTSLIHLVPKLLA
jgi:hypothetical protein